MVDKVGAKMGGARARRSRSPSRVAGILGAALGASLIGTPPALADGRVHVVAPGQTLGAIAKRYHTTVEALRDANELKAGARIRPGLELSIPDEGGRGKGARAMTRDAASERRAARASGAPFEGKPRHPGVVRLARGAEQIDVRVLRHGRLAPGALVGVERMLRYFPTNTRVPIDPRLATLIGMVSDHFGGRTIRIVSGYRPHLPSQYAAHSNHNIGKAFDFVVDGVPATVVRDYCRTLHNAGVGYYPNSTFVHLDVRSTSSYWIDYSRAGERPRYDPAHDVASADEAVSDLGAGSTEPQDAPRDNKGISDTTDSIRDNSRIQGEAGPTSPHSSAHVVR